MRSASTGRFAACTAAVGILACVVPGCFASSSGGNAPDAGFAFDSALAFDVGQGSCADGWVQAPDGTCYLNLEGAWSSSEDANTDGTATVASLGTVTPLSVSVEQSHTGMDLAECGCNSQHRNIPLGKTFQCSAATLEFKYTTTAMADGTDTPAVDIRFCTGPCPGADGGTATFYGGPQYVGSPFAPTNSNCAYEWENAAGTASLNMFPASAKIVDGQKTSIALGTYSAPTTGDDCTGSFDTIDVHIQVYNCAASETGTSTLSYLRVY
jgi:hypothetical protein